MEKKYVYNCYIKSLEINPYHYQQCIAKFEKNLLCKNLHMVNLHKCTFHSILHPGNLTWQLPQFLNSIVQMNSFDFLLHNMLIACTAEMPEKIITWNKYLK